MKTDRFPIQGYGTIPWRLAEQAYETYASLFGKDQSLEQLGERGGFGFMEWAILWCKENPCKTGPWDRKEEIVSKAVRALVSAEIEDAR